MLLIVFGTTNCDNEIDVGPDINPNTLDLPDITPTGIDYITVDEEPEILAILDQQMVETSEKSVSGKSVNYKKSYINLKKIMKVKNSEGIVNYGMNLILEDGKPNEFFNVIINESAKGKKKDAYIVKYSMTPEDHAYFAENGSDIKHFKGKRTIMTFDSFYRALEGVESKSEGTSHECPDIEDSIDNTGAGEDGGFNQISGSNSITPTDYVNSGSSSGYYWYINAYNTMNSSPTRHMHWMEVLQYIKVKMKQEIHGPENPWVKPPVGNGLASLTLYHGFGSGCRF